MAVEAPFQYSFERTDSLMLMNEIRAIESQGIIKLA